MFWNNLFNDGSGLDSGLDSGLEITNQKDISKDGCYFGRRF